MAQLGAFLAPFALAVAVSSSRLWVLEGMQAPQDPCQEAEPHWSFVPRDELRTCLVSGSSLLACSNWWLWWVMMHPGRVMVLSS